MISPIQRLYRNRVAKTVVTVALCSLLSTAGAIGGQANGATATIVFVRTARSRSAAWDNSAAKVSIARWRFPAIIAKYFDRVDAIFAPNPSHPKEDAGELYDYIRPLATIEPTAIWFGLPE